MDQLPFADRPSVQTYSGRVAIYQGLKHLGLGSGDIILVPAYACGSEIDAVLKSGCQVRFYPLNTDLSPNLDRCKELLSAEPEIKAFFLIHYFGFPQPLEAITELTRAHNLILFEDCAHAFLSDDPSGQALGTTGEVAIFSYMKTLPLTDGGALVINSGATPQGDLQKPNVKKLIGRFLFQVERSLEKSSPRIATLFQMCVRKPLQKLKGGRGKAAGSGEATQVQHEAPAAEETESDILSLDLRRANWSMSGLAQFTAKRLDLPAIKAARRHNYARLLCAIQNVDGLRPLFPTLPQGTCPLFFPIEVNDAANAQKGLGKAGLSTKLFWSFFHETFPREEFPFETALKTSVIALPIHQDLNDTQIDEMAKILQTQFSTEAAA
ncbi:DegT/DnrJ/EryC1/StrS family aminotransferase [Litoreibacter janthinus]|nr:DegT/DnrJ/EryC1/StrS family aminotransferase [Litoreibacter janthinus]